MNRKKNTNWKNFPYTKLNNLSNFYNLNMKHIIKKINGMLLAVFCLTFVFVACTNTKTEKQDEPQNEIQNALTPQEQSEGWQLLFDGTTLNGWRDFNGVGLTGPWEVKDGCLYAEGGGSDSDGYIVTDKTYENFELSWDWKISKGGNSGVLYHVVEGAEYKVPYATGPEFQLIDDENFPHELEDWQRCGVDYAMHLPDFSTMKVNPAGEWNNSKIVFNNGHVEHWMNGDKIIEFKAWTEEWFALKNSGKWDDFPMYGLAREGVICLQDHGDPVWFRNIKIKVLPGRSE